MADTETCPSCDGKQDFECATCGNKWKKRDWIDNIIDAIVPWIVYKEWYHLPWFPPLQWNEALRQIIEAHYPKSVSGETSD